MKKRILLTIVLAIALFSFAGCDSQSITPEQIQALASKQQVLQQKADEAQAMAESIAKQMQDAGITDANLTAKIAAINIQADKWQSQANDIAAALQGVQLTGDTATDWINTIRAVNTATSPFNPYALPVEVGLGVLATALGWFAKKKAADEATAQAKYQAHKQGVEKTMKQVSASDNTAVKAVEAQLYHNIGEARKANAV
jgi:hypothetical protein